jgi:hypothetical protein
MRRLFNNNRENFVAQACLVSIRILRTLVASGGGGGDTVLEQAFDAMSLGAFANYTAATNDGFSLIQGTSGNILEFGARGCYDPIHKIAKYLGSDHAGTQKEITLTLSTNAWTSVAGPDDGATNQHTYYMFTMDPATGDLYTVPFSDVDLTVRRKLFGGNWSTIASLPSRGSSVGCLEWNPNLGSGAGGLVYADNGGIHTWVKGAGSWVTQLTHNRGGWLDPFSATLGTGVRLGGGDSATDATNLRWWDVAASGADTQLANNLPIAMGISGKAIVFPHPSNSARLLAFGGAGGDDDIREYNSVGDSWSIIGTHPLVSNAGGEWKSGIVFPNRGIMFLQTTGADLTTTLYRA